MKKLSSFLLSISLLSASIPSFAIDTIDVTGTYFDPNWITDRSPGSGARPQGQGATAEGRSIYEQIQKEIKKKWCADTKAKIPIAIKECITNASTLYANNLVSICKGQVSQTVSGSITAWIFGGEVSTTTSCQLVQEAERDATLARCESDGAKVERVVNDQCKGV